MHLGINLPQIFQKVLPTVGKTNAKIFQIFRTRQKIIDYRSTHAAQFENK
jgi:hypothetical protein